LKVAQIYLEKASAQGAQQFREIIESLDRLAIEQHVLVASADLAKRLGGLPYVTVGPLVSTPVMAYCLVPEVDVAHIHDGKSGQVGLLLTLTRSTPYVLNTIEAAQPTRNPLLASIRNRARLSVDTNQLRPEKLVDAYRDAIDGLSKSPKDANGGQ
jgi:hypothetical protein